MNLLEIDKPRTIYQGRSQILSDGGLFVEETEHGRHLRYSKGKLLWSKINYYDENYIGMLSWSRYLTADEAAKPLAAILAGNCEK